MNEQIERNRMELILALRSGRYKQIFGRYFDGKGGVCLFGVIMQLFNYNEKSDKHTELGLSFDSSIQLTDLNDSGKTFPELADILVKDYGFPDAHIEEPVVELQEVAV